ncbi:MAG: hypothetical protein JWN08_924 [Frankiales bacterium]|nr:hypothetical protein [Frankiales bacterium]
MKLEKTLVALATAACVLGVAAPAQAVEVAYLDIVTTKAHSDGGVLLQRVTKGEMKGAFKPVFAVSVQVRCGTADAPTTEWVYVTPVFSHTRPVEPVTCDGTLKTITFSLTGAVSRNTTVTASLGDVTDTQVVRVSGQVAA